MRSRWWRIARIALGGLVLLAVIVGVDPAALLERLRGADLAVALPAIAGLTIIHAVPAAAWRAMVAAGEGRRLGWRVVLSTYYAAQAIGGLTPANLAGDVHRAATLRRWGADWRTSVAPLVIQRATSYLALSGLAVLGLLLLSGRAPEANRLVLVGLASAIAVAAMAWLLVMPPRRLPGVCRRLAGQVAAEGWTATESRVGARRAALIGLASGVAFHAGSVGLAWLLVLSIDPGATSWLLPGALVVARLALAVPLTPSGLGIQEGALVLLVGAAGMSAESALAGMLLARLALVLTTGLGVGLLLRGMPDDRGVASAAHPASLPPAR